MRLHTMVKLHEQGPTVPGKLPRQRQQPFQLRVADTASPYRIANIFGEVLVYKGRSDITKYLHFFFERDFRMN